MTTAQRTEISNDAIEHTDIIVVGGGVVGALLCQGLLQAELGLHITLVTTSESNTAVYADDIRALALSHHTLSQLVAMGIDPGFIKSNIEQIHISDRGNIGQARLTAREQGVDALGYVTQISVLEQAISGALNASAEKGLLTLVEQAECIDICTDNDAAKVCVLDTGKQIHARAIILADGQVSRLKNTIGIASEVTDYGQQGIVAVVGVDRCGPARYQQPLTAFERFTEQGPLALLPVSFAPRKSDSVPKQPDTHIKQYYSLVWCTNEQRATELMALSNEAFLQALQNEFGDRAGRFAYLSTRQSFALKLTRHDDTDSSVLCIGNAAQALHPIAGQGFNLAVRDIVDVIASITSLPDISDLGSSAHWQDVRLRRAKDRNTVISATNGLLYGFSNNHCLLSNARAKGLTALHLATPIKKWLAKMAMGYR
jgi:2-octaprenyl-6-methoxyphenol hydroxylase